MSILFFQRLFFTERNLLMNLRRFMSAVLFILALCLVSGCTKKIDGSSMAKYYISSAEVMKTISGEDRQLEFANGLELILFFAADPSDALAELDGKTADQVFEIIQQYRDSKPTIDASRREKYASSLSDVLKSIPTDSTRDILKDRLVKYGFFPWNSKNEAKIRSLEGKNAFEINSVISDIRRDEDPTKM